MRIALTGSRGFLGRHIAAAAGTRGLTLVPVPLSDRLTRPEAGLLRAQLQPAEGADVLINCAAAKKPRDATAHFLNGAAPRIMQDFMTATGGWLLHISTINVLFPSLRDSYSLDKRAGEAALAADHVRIVRPGLIWSPTGDGESDVIKRYLDLPLPFHPLPRPGNLYQPVDPAGLAHFVLDQAEAGPDFASAINVVGAQDLTLWDLTRAMALARGRKPIPVPTALLRAAALGLAPRLFPGKTLLHQFLDLDRRIDGIGGQGDLVKLPFEK